MSDRGELGNFLAISVSLHVVVALLTAFIRTAPIVTIPPVIRVSVIMDAAPKANENFLYGKIMEMPEQKKPALDEKPEKAEILSSLNARAKAKKKGDALKLRPAPDSREMKVAEYAPEKQRHKQSSDNPNPSGEVRTTALENRFSEVALADAKHDKGGEQSPLQRDTLAKTERETAKEQRALSAEDVDRFAVSNPAGVLETDSEIVIPFNTRKFEYMDYFSSLRRTVSDAWNYPDEAMQKGIGGRTLLRITVDRGGILEEVKVISSAGTQALDDAALDAVRRSAPFKPFPDTLSKQRIHIVATFNYSPRYGKVP